MVNGAAATALQAVTVLITDPSDPLTHQTAADRRLVVSLLCTSARVKVRVNRSAVKVCLDFQRHERRPVAANLSFIAVVHRTLPRLV